MMEHLPKINISLGVLVVICFFLPWVSIDCGSLTIVNFSGYDLAAGRVPIDKNALHEARARFGKSNQEYISAEREQQTQPQLYFLMVLVCALGLVAYGYRMLSELNKVTAIAIAGFGLLGALIMLYSSWRNFGMDIPADAAMFIHVSDDVAFYLTTLSFLGSAVLSIVGLREFYRGPPKKAVVNTPVFVSTIPVEEIEQLPVEVENNHSAQSDFSDFVNLPATEPMKPPPQSGAKVCPSCSATVSIYQTKCLKCGTKLKHGK